MLDTYDYVPSTTTHEHAFVMTRLCLLDLLYVGSMNHDTDLESKCWFG